jgi:2-succinyl-5-enolpyruvyl-6-hydroxy-3-cyclohexene-1-carboxylate synthase
METPLDFRSVNALWSSVLVRALTKCGITRAVISPGSRSTPLALAFARCPVVESVPVLDERSAGFFALGLAKVSSAPVVLVCTSGTAAANYFPAIVEARESGVPLLVLTADRPPEMRASASGQTIDQQKLYGGYVSFYHELAVPELDLGRLRYLRQTVAHAVTCALMPMRGPVHLNVPFRDPLPPLDDGGATRAFAETVNWAEFFGHLAVASTEVTVPAGPFGVTRVPPIEADVHGLIVVGPNQPEAPAEFARQIGTLSRRLGWPVLGDGLSPLRNHASEVPHLVTTYDTILRNPAAAERLRPDIVLCVGEWPTSKVLRGWLERHDSRIWLISGRTDNRDALHGRTTQVSLPLRSLVDSIPDAPAAGGYAGMWLKYEQVVRDAIEARFATELKLLEPKASWLLAQHMPEGTPLLNANSMPIRDVEYFWPARDGSIRPLCNRGANGIDGTLSTAFGVAQATGRPAVLLTGDLALLHDTNGFLLAAKFHGSLTIIVINNDGGGIFEHLPVARFDPPFEEFFATPQRVDLPQLCGAYDVAYTEVTSWPQFTTLVSTLPPAGVRLLEIRTDRKRDAAWRKQWFADLAATLG